MDTLKQGPLMEVTSQYIRYDIDQVEGIHRSVASNSFLALKQHIPCMHACARILEPRDRKSGASIEIRRVHRHRLR